MTADLEFSFYIYLGIKIFIGVGHFLLNIEYNFPFGIQVHSWVSLIS